MKCRIFSGPWNQTQDSFNNWAKGKALTKEIIIHTAATPIYKANEYSVYVTIAVYYPEDSVWDTPTDKWEQAVKDKDVKPTGAYEKAIT